jgi:transcription antitermination factor NusG
MQWYVLRVAANKEVQVKDTLAQKVEREGLADIIGRIEVPVGRWNRPMMGAFRKRPGS